MKKEEKTKKKKEKKVEPLRYEEKKKIEFLERARLSRLDDGKKNE